VPLLKDHDKVFAYLRKYKGKTILIVANFSDEDLQVDLSEVGAVKVEVLTSNDVINCSDLSNLHLAPYDATVLAIQ
jgi:hypothetical protein